MDRVGENDKIGRVIPYLLYLYAFAVCISVSVTHIVLAFIFLLFLIDWWMAKRFRSIRNDFSIFAAIYGWKGITLIANGLILKVYRVKEIWYKMPYLLISNFRITSGNLNKILHILFFTDSLIVVYAIVQRFIGAPIIYYTLFEVDQMRGYLENPQYYAGHMTIAIILCLSLSLFYKKSFAAYMPFLFTGLLISASRTYLVCGIMVVLLISLFKSRSVLMFTLVSISFVLILEIIFFPAFLSKLSSNIVSSNLSLRMSFWGAAWETYLEHKLFGVGFQEFFLTYMDVLIKNGTVPFAGNAHNLYLQELVEGGPVELFLVLFGMIYFIRKYYLLFKKNDDRLLSAISIAIAASFIALMIAGVTEAFFEFPTLWFLLTFIMGLAESYRLNIPRLTGST
ncbi:MAG: O-antigen ligase family protein [Nitrospinota bacterium]